MTYPRREKYYWWTHQHSNHWLKQIHKRFDQHECHISWAMKCLMMCEHEVPIYTYTSDYLDDYLNGTSFPDTNFDMSGYAPFDECIKILEICHKQFNYDVHGSWITYAEAHCLEYLDNNKCKEYLEKNIEETKKINERMTEAFGHTPLKIPAWMDTMLAYIHSYSQKSEPKE